MVSPRSAGARGETTLTDTGEHRLNGPVRQVTERVSEQLCPVFVQVLANSGFIKPWICCHL